MMSVVNKTSPKVSLTTDASAHGVVGASPTLNGFH